MAESRKQHHSTKGRTPQKGTETSADLTAIAALQATLAGSLW